MMQAVIVAGGMGLRLGDLTKDTPKGMIRIGGRPVLEHQIELLKKYGFRDIIILTGYRSDVIERHFKDGGAFGVKIDYSVEEKPLGTAGGVKEIEDRLTGDFVVLYGDVMMNVDLKKVADFHKRKAGACTLVLHSNDHFHDSDLVEIDADKRVAAFHAKPHAEGKHYRNLVNAGVYILSVKILEHIKKGVKADFGKDVFPGIVGKEKMFGYVSAEYLKDMGTPRRLKEVEEDYLQP